MPAATNLVKLNGALQAIKHETIAVLEEARAAGLNDLALEAIERLEKQLELERRLFSELNAAPSVDLQMTPEWAALRAKILAALEPYPAARSAVAGVVSQ